MLFKKSSSSSRAPGASDSRSIARAAAGSAGPIANPYLNARREWDERYGDLISRAKNWRMAAIGAIGVAAIAVFGVVFIGSQSKIQPFVIAVDDLGSPVAVARPAQLQKAGQHDERVVKAQLANFIFNARSLMRDFASQQVLIDRAFAMLSTDVAPMVTEFQRDVRLPLQKKGTVVSVQVQTVIPAGPDTWQIDWIEVTQEPGLTAQRENWRALISIGFDEKIASNPELFYWNPLGIYIKQINWQKVSA